MSPLSSPAFRRWLILRWTLTVAIQMQSVAIGWLVYDRTGRALDLGWVGLSQFVPLAALSLVGGQVVDRYDRKTVMLCGVAVLTLCPAGFAIASASGAGLWSVLAVSALFAVGRAFTGPAAQAILPQIAPEESFTQAVALNTTVWQVGAIAGPAIGGLLYALMGGATGVFLISFAMLLLALGILATLQPRPVALSTNPIGFANLAEGFRFVRGQPLLVGAIGLDLFAVLLGGATALLPALARDTLHTGPWGLGILRSAPAIGAACMAAFLSFYPLRRRAGSVLYASVAGFGVCMIVFGLSRSLPLSFLALLVSGAFDSVSVVVRHTLLQTRTPVEMRGRVGSVSQVCISASNELGEFESGIAASILGPVGAVIFGGIGTIAIVAVWSGAFPELLRVDRLDERRPSADT